MVVEGQAVCETSLRKVMSVYVTVSRFASVIQPSRMNAYNQAKGINDNFLSKTHRYWVKPLVYISSVSLLRYFRKVVLFAPCDPGEIFTIRGFGHLERSQLVSR